MVEPNAPATSSGLVLDGKFHESPFRPFSGWLLAPVSVALLGGAVLLVVMAARHSSRCRAFLRCRVESCSCSHCVATSL